MIDLILTPIKKRVDRTIFKSELVVYTWKYLEFSCLIV